MIYFGKFNNKNPGKIINATVVQECDSRESYFNQEITESCTTNSHKALEIWTTVIDACIQ